MPPSLSSTGRCRRSPTTTKTLIRFVLMTAQSSGLYFPTRRWVDAHVFHGYSGVLMMLISGLLTECKTKKPSDWLQIGRLAVRMTVPLVSRCRALGEAAHDGNYWFDKSRTNLTGIRYDTSGILRAFAERLMPSFEMRVSPVSPTCGGTKSYQALCA